MTTQRTGQVLLADDLHRLFVEIRPSQRVSAAPLTACQGVVRNSHVARDAARSLAENLGLQGFGLKAIPQRTQRRPRRPEKRRRDLASQPRRKIRGGRESRLLRFWAKGQRGRRKPRDGRRGSQATHRTAGLKEQVRKQRRLQHPSQQQPTPTPPRERTRRIGSKTSPHFEAEKGQTQSAIFRTRNLLLADSGCIFARIEGSSLQSSSTHCRRVLCTGDWTFRRPSPERISNARLEI